MPAFTAHLLEEQIVSATRKKRKNSARIPEVGERFRPPAAGAGSRAEGSSVPGTPTTSEQPVGEKLARLNRCSRGGLAGASFRVARLGRWGTSPRRIPRPATRPGGRFRKGAKQPESLSRQGR